MRFAIYTDDHEPAHVHVYGDGEARIDIGRIAVLSNRGMTKRTLARALAIVQQEHKLLQKTWEEIHG
jgi:hypothetical protein